MESLIKIECNASGPAHYRHSSKKQFDISAPSGYMGWTEKSEVVIAALRYLIEENLDGTDRQRS